MTLFLLLQTTTTKRPINRVPPLLHPTSDLAIYSTLHGFIVAHDLVVQNTAASYGCAVGGVVASAVAAVARVGAVENQIGGCCCGCCD